MTRPALPLIGLSGRRWPAERIPLLDYTALHGEEVDLHLSEYPKMVERAGGLPVQLTHNTSPVDIVARFVGPVVERFGGGQRAVLTVGECGPEGFGAILRA